MRRLCTPAWITRHVVTVGLVAAFLGLGWWQISRAAAGNTLSWAYAIEWPIFAGFVVFLWVREVRHALGRSDPATPPAEDGAGKDAPPAGRGGRDVPSGSAEPTRAGVRRPVRSVRAPVAVPTDDDPTLAAYNDYLSWLNANPGARPGDYPGPGR